MELKHLITFKQVAKTLSFSRAAEELNYAQPTISAQIQALETELGVALFNRLGRQIILTEAGKELLSYAEKLTDLADEARSAMGQIGKEPLGDVRIGASESILAYHLPPLIKGFQAQFPTVRLVINPTHHDNLVEAVRDGQIDIALAYRESIDDSLGSEFLLNEPAVLVTAPGHALAHKSQIKPDDLAGQTLLAPFLHCPYRLLFQRLLDEHGVEMTTNYEFNSTHPIKQFASQGGGIALLPAPNVASEIKNGELAQLNWAGATLSIPIMMIWHPDKWESAAVASLKQYLRENFAQKQLEKQSTNGRQQQR